MTPANSRLVPQEMQPTISKPAIGLPIEFPEQRVVLHRSLTSAGPLLTEEIMAIPPDSLL